VPISLGMMLSGSLSPEAVATISGACVLATLMLGAMGEITRKIVGMVYISPTKEEIIISHLTFFGGRKDVLLNTSEVMPFEESNENASSLFWKIKLYDTTQEFYICSRFGGVQCKDSFITIFGRS